MIFSTAISSVLATAGEGYANYTARAKYLFWNAVAALLQQPEHNPDDAFGMQYYTQSTNAIAATINLQSIFPAVTEERVFTESFRVLPASSEPTGIVFSPIPDELEGRYKYLNFTINANEVYYTVKYPYLKLYFQAGSTPSANVIVERSGYKIPGSTYAAKATDLTGANNDLIFTAVTAGTAGNSIQIVYLGGTDRVLSVFSVVGSVITIQLATSGTTITSTAAQVLAVVNASAAASALVRATLVPGETGTGLVTAMSAMTLSGGTDGVDIADATELNNYMTMTMQMKAVELAAKLLIQETSM